jgi:hypothetical protein
MPMAYLPMWYLLICRWICRVTVGAFGHAMQERFRIMRNGIRCSCDGTTQWDGLWLFSTWTWAVCICCTQRAQQTHDGRAVVPRIRSLLHEINTLRIEGLVGVLAVDRVQCVCLQFLADLLAYFSYCDICHFGSANSQPPAEAGCFLLVCHQMQRRERRDKYPL